MLLVPTKKMAAFFFYLALPLKDIAIKRSQNNDSGDDWLEQLAIGDDWLAIGDDWPALTAGQSSPIAGQSSPIAGQSSLSQFLISELSL